MKTLEGVEITGPLCKTMDKKSLLLHKMVASCVADMLESEDQLSVKRGNQKAMSWHMCKYRKKDMCIYSVPPRKFCSKTKAILDGIR